MNTNYKKDFVPYQQALELKQLEFNEPCFGYYSNGELICSSHTNNMMQRFRYAAPTYGQAFRFFREKYHFVGTILGDGFNGELKGYYYSITEEGWINYYESIDDGKWYDTYEEAEQACLDKLIEIVKNATENNQEKS
jgi:hypothetical protein